mgnify:CR=1 FL=1
MSAEQKAPMQFNLKHEAGARAADLLIYGEIGFWEGDAIDVARLLALFLALPVARPLVLPMAPPLALALALLLLLLRLLLLAMKCALRTLSGLPLLVRFPPSPIR